MKIRPWLECEDEKEVQEGNRLELASGIIFYLNHEDCTALMNDNSAAEVDRIEACKFIASLGYTPQEITHG